jgi:hypothetical protein
MQTRKYREIETETETDSEQKTPEIRHSQKDYSCKALFLPLLLPIDFHRPRERDLAVPSVLSLILVISDIGSEPDGEIMLSRCARACLFSWSWSNWCSNGPGMGGRAVSGSDTEPRRERDSVHLRRLGVAGVWSTPAATLPDARARLLSSSCSSWVS